MRACRVRKPPGAASRCRRRASLFNDLNAPSGGDSRHQVGTACPAGAPRQRPGRDAILRAHRFVESSVVAEISRQQLAGTPAPAPGGIAARARAAVAAPYLAGLNPEQREAVETLDGPVLVLAGAGTGKTRVLTTRIAHILSLGRARPSEILAVTFTNKAAREMKGRVGAMVGQIVEGMPWLGTFHSIGVKILRRHAELVGLKPDFTILDVDDQIRLLKQLLEAENIDEKRWPRPRARLDHRRLEEPRAHPRQGAAGRSRDLRERTRHRALQGLSGAAEDAQRRRLRRPADRDAAAVPRAYGSAAAVSRALQIRSGRRVSGHQRRAVSLAAPDRPGLEEHLLRRRRRPVDLWLARRRGRQHPALREGLSRRQGDPARAQLPLDRPYPRRRVASDRPQ